ncbi:hypothetical protein GUJ93_ZPchr0011g27205 [Zizania palustris]|uniref:Uncharacterized protein n=1 Tax=Zizania palustris TaxID=103762 RepID=A0A8J6BPM8_ZIZPA|nr:hypothetical protein GUJ93_ZPchr0011g27205 [Zizania palustris]
MAQQHGKQTSLVVVVVVHGFCLKKKRETNEAEAEAADDLLMDSGARLAASVSAVLDRRDVPGGDIALHLAVRLRLTSVASALAAASADPTLQNHAGWTPLQEALFLGCKDIAACLLRAHRLAAWAKLRRRWGRRQWRREEDRGEEEGTPCLSKRSTAEQGACYGGGCELGGGGRRAVEGVRVGQRRAMKEASGRAGGLVAALAGGRCGGRQGAALASCAVTGRQAGAVRCDGGS